MREIKFRGKDLETGEWVYGSLFQSLEQYPAIAKPKPTADGNLFYCLTVVDADTVGQYTGLEDRNGKDVWEGDLLRTPEGDIMVVEWIDAKIITRCVRPYNPRYKNSLTFAYPVSVVVGNIYDNPELLEEEQ